MNAFDQERVQTGVNLIRNHYSLNDKVKNDHLIFVNAILTTIGAEIGILYHHASLSSVDYIWHNITHVDWESSKDQFEKIFDISPQVVFPNLAQHTLTLFSYEWQHRGYYRVESLDKDDHRVVIVRAILRRLHKDELLGQNALNRTISSFLNHVNLRPALRNLPVKKNLDSAIGYFAENALRNTLDLLYQDYVDTYLVRLPKIEKEDKTSSFPIFFARQIHSYQQRFYSANGYRYGIQLLLSREQMYQDFKFDHKDIEGFEKTLGNERSVLDTTFSLGVVRRVDISKDEDNYQWPYKYKPTEEEVHAKYRRNQHTTKIIYRLANEPVKGIQATIHPLLWFGSPYCAVCLIHPRFDDDFSNPHHGLWRQRHLFYSELVMTRMARKFRASMTRQVIDLIKRRTRNFVRIYGNDLKIIQTRLARLFDELAMQLPIPQIDITYSRSVATRKTSSNEIHLIPLREGEHFVISKRENQVWDSGFTKVLDTKIVDSRFIKTVSEIIRDELAAESFLWYKRFLPTNLDVHTDSMLGRVAEQSSQLFKGNAIHKLIVIQGQESQYGASIKQIATVIAGAIGGDSTAAPLYCTISNDISYWNTMAQLLPHEKLLKLADLELGLSEFPDNSFLSTSGDWARINPEGTVVVFMHDDDLQPSSTYILRLQILLEQFYTTKCGSLVLSVKDHNLIKHTIKEHKFISLSRLRKEIKKVVEIFHG